MTMALLLLHLGFIFNMKNGSNIKYRAMCHGFFQEPYNNKPR